MKYANRDLSSILLIFGWLALGSLCGGASGGSFGLIWKNNGAVEKLKKDQAMEAYRDFSEAVVDDPQNAVVHLNLGDTFMINKEYDKALQEFMTAARTAPDPETRFAAYFNAGVAAQQSKKVEDAIKFYQQALDLEPTSKETKTNIEFLFMSQNGGGGDGEQEKDDQKGDGKNNDKQNQPNPNQKYSQNKPKPQPFNGKELSKQDVDKILGELKRQEEQIRGRVQNVKSRDTAPDKDW